MRKPLLIDNSEKPRTMSVAGRINSRLQRREVRLRGLNPVVRDFSEASISLLLCLTIVAVNADDWPQWRGPIRNGISAEKGWLDVWPADKAPKVAWRASVGKGHSAVSIANGRAYTMGWDGTNDTVFCFDAVNGKLLWKQSYPCGDIVQWSGPRATPTVDGETVYTLGQHGQLHAYHAVTGKKIWAVQLPESYQPDVDYGFAWSPLVQGDLLLLAAGKRGLALNKRDGTFAWGNDGQHGACASPVPYVHAGQRGVALITTEPGRNSVTLVGVDPQTGRELWRHGPWREKWGAACVDLLIADGKIFITTSEQYPRCARYSLREGKLTEDWSNKSLNIYTGGCVLLNNHLYAVNRTGILKCLDWNTGTEKWAERGFGGHGTLIAADNKLLIQSSQTGEIVVVEATPNAYRELRRAKLFSGKPDTFTAPVLANGRLYCRSYEGELLCLDLR